MAEVRWHRSVLLRVASGSLALCFSAAGAVRAEPLTIEDVLAEAAVAGLAVQESHGPETPVEAFGTLVIDLKGGTMRLTNFSVIEGAQAGGDAAMATQDFELTTVEVVHPGNIVMRGKDDGGSRFMANLSTSDGRFDFLLVIEGGGGREIRNIGREGLALKAQYAPGVELGLGDDE